jgi:hypothetical protein
MPEIGLRRNHQFMLMAALVILEFVGVDTLLWPGTATLRQRLPECFEH